MPNKKIKKKSGLSKERLNSKGILQGCGGRAYYCRENALTVDLQEFQKLDKRGFSFIERRKQVKRTGCAEVR